jgi:NADH-quinone oxidoreductase subunit N
VSSALQAAGPAGIQSVDLLAVGPPLLVAVAGIALLVLDLFVADLRGAARRWVLPAGSLVALGAALALVARQGWSAGATRRTFCLEGAGPGGGPACSYDAGDLALVLQAAMLLATAVVVLLAVHTVEETRLPGGEFHFLVLASASGALTLAAAGDLLTLLVALEVVSLPAYGLVALRRTDGRATEAALKFFLVSVVSTAVTLYGISLVYGVTGAVHLDAVRAALADPETRMPVTALGVGLTVAAFAFKVAAVPFHFWAPDTYVGAPLPVTAYLSVVSKAAGFVGLLLVLVEAFRPYADVWGPLVAVLAALTMTVGNLVALRQRQAVRLLAWSSVAQAGYMLAPLGAAAGAAGRDASLDDAAGATVVYVLVYVAMNLGAFAVVSVVGRERPRNLLADYRGLARRAPLVGGALALFLAALAGLPPGLSGLFAKVAVFRATVEGEVGWLAVVVAVNTVLGLYYYLAWAVTLFAPMPVPAPAPAPGAAPAPAPAAAAGTSADEPSPEPAGEGAPAVAGVTTATLVRAPAASRPPVALAAALAVTAAATVALSVAPELVFQVVPGVAAQLP